MNRDERYEQARKVIVLFGFWMFGGIFWGAVFAGIARITFDLSEFTALLWMGLPVLILFLPFTIFVLSKALKKAGII